MKLKQKLMSSSLAMILIASTVYTTFAASKQNMQIEFINVGAGDAIYIETPSGDDILIDSGTAGNGSKVVNYLKSHEKSMDLEYVISTHPDADHVGGLQEVFKSLKVKRFYYPKDVAYSTQTAKNVINLAKKESGCKIYDAKNGIKIKSSGANLEFVHSSKNYSSDNQDSVMTYIDYGNLEVLLTGDAEKGAEAAAKKYNCDIVQVPHHGSSGSSSSNFINKFDPEKIVISTDGKKYGHPNKATLDRYAKYDKNIDVYRTDRNGNISIYANGSKWWISTNKNSSEKIGKTKAGDSNKDNSSNSSTSYVYCNGGSSSSNKYHKTSTAHGMKGAIKMTESVAKKKGYVACKVCY